MPTWTLTRRRGCASLWTSVVEAEESFDKGKLDVVNVTGATIGRTTFEPGWKWSDCVKPIVGTDSCQTLHTGYVVSGRMNVVMDYAKA